MFLYLCSPVILILYTKPTMA